MTASSSDPAVSQSLPEPIPLRVLFGNPDKRSPSISPNGKYYAYLADAENGVTNVFVKPVEFRTDVEEAVLVDAVAQQITNEAHRPIPMFAWARVLDTLRLFYLQDKDGDENFHLYCADFDMDESHKVQNLHVRDLTPFENLRVSQLETSKHHPDVVYVAMNKRDPRFFDMYRINVQTGDVELDVENPGVVLAWLMDDQFVVRSCVTMNPEDGSNTLRYRASAEQSDPNEWKVLGVWPHGEELGVHSFNKDGSAIYVSTTMSHDGSEENPNTSRLVLLSVEDGKELQVVAQDETCDIDQASFDKNACTPRYVVFNHTKSRVQVINEDLREDLELLINSCKGTFELVSVSDNDKFWMFVDKPDTASPRYYIFDRSTKRLGLLFEALPELSKYTLASMTPHVIKTSDNEDMVVYVTLPHGVPAEKLPFVLNVHGGPWARDVWRFDPTHQLFANRGYGCISVNFRGSTGLGKRWTNLGDKQWAATMQQDLSDVVAWAIKQGYADESRFAIFGGSYGGYATLAGLAFTPELYACGVDIVGPSNVDTLFKSIPPYWEPMKKLLVLRVGDVENDVELNERISPLFHAHKMCRPLLIAQGANDPRVKQAESDQIAKKLYSNKQQVKYILYKDEGHGFQRPQNRLDFMFRVEEFFAEHLGGRKTERDLDLIEGNSAVEIDPAAL